MYDKEEITNLIQRFAPVLTEEEVNCIPSEFSSFKVYVSKLRSSEPRAVFKEMLLQPPKNCKNFMPLVQIMLTISMSTAVVERGFSHMNIVKSSTCTLLGNDTLNNLLEVKLNGPSVKEFNPDEAIIHWYKAGKGKRHTNGHKTKNKE